MFFGFRCWTWYAQIIPKEVRELKFSSKKYYTDVNKIFDIFTGEDNAYIFNSSTSYRPIRKNTKEERVSKILNQILASFAYTGYEKLLLFFINHREACF